MFAASFRRTLISTRPVVRPMVSRGLSTTRLAWSAKSAKPPAESKVALTLEDAEGPEDLAAPGGKDGEIPTDLEQAVGAERLELLGKLRGVEVFDTKPLDSSRKGTMKDPIIVDSFDDFRYVGCTGSPAGSHEVQWLVPKVGKPARCWECGSVYALNMIGTPKDDEHH